LCPSCRRDEFLSRNLPSVRVEAGGFDFAFEHFLELGGDVVFDAVGGFVNVVKGQAEELHEVGFPEAVGAYELAGGVAAGGG
jgi:hypothetical protein